METDHNIIIRLQTAKSKLAWLVKSNFLTALFHSVDDREKKMMKLDLKRTPNNLLLKFPTEKSDICCKVIFSHIGNIGIQFCRSTACSFCKYSRNPFHKIHLWIIAQLVAPVEYYTFISIKKWKISIIEIFGLSPKNLFFPTFYYKYPSLASSSQVHIERCCAQQ